MTLPSGIPIDELDPGIRPQDDLFRHVNGRWLARTKIPADRARDSAFRILADQAENAVREIVEEAASAPEGSEERKLGDMYASFMDTDRAELLGSQPISQTLTAARAVSSIPELLETLGRLQPSEIGGLYRLFVDTDPGNPERYLVFFGQAAISLPDESYYREARFAGVRDAFVGHVQRMFELAGLPDADQAARRVFALETAVAGHHWDSVASRDREKAYNLFTWTGVLTEGPDLRRWLAALDPPSGAFDEIVLRQPSYSAGLASLLTAEHVPAWRDWLCWQVIHSAAGYLSEAFVQEDFDFYGRILSGTPQLRERWKRGVSLVEWAMGEAVGRAYVGRHFPPGTRERMDVLVANLLEAYRQSINKLEWMGAGTRRRALDKLGKFTPKIGYPDRWRDYSSLRIDPADLMANVRAAHAFEFRRQLNKVGKPVDRDEWHMTPQTVNAYYNPGMNEIVFPAAILQDPFFNPDRDDAANYGAIGAIIGHEIGHGFDDQGSKYDGGGRLTDWWSATDRQAFETRTRSLIEQYNGLAPKQAPAQHVNGALTIGENIGDLGGLGIAWKAYQVSLHGEEAPVIDRLTGGQRFFMSWARTWQQKVRDEEAIRLLVIDRHSPGEFRCNQIVRNLDEFYGAFDVGATTSCGSNLQLGSVSGSQGHTARRRVGDIGGRDSAAIGPAEPSRPARPAVAVPGVLSFREFRAGLAGVLDRIRRSPDTAVFVGAHRRAEAVLVSVEQYEALQEAASGSMRSRRRWRRCEPRGWNPVRRTWCCSPRWRPGGCPPMSRGSGSCPATAGEQRDRQIIADVITALGKHRNCLVLTNWTSHLEQIASLPRDAGHDPVVLRGGMGAKAARRRCAACSPSPADRRS